MTEKAWENAVLGLGNEADIKRGKRRKERGKGGKDRRLRGRRRERKEPIVPFSATLFMDAFFAGLHEGSIRQKFFMKGSNETSRV